MKNLVQQRDNQAIELLSRATSAPVVNISGDQNSPFIKAIINKCNKLGIGIIQTPIITANIPTIVDIETSTKFDILDQRSDIDVISCEGLSCCADAVSCILKENEEVDFENSHVLIIGRGHSVKGLRELLDHWNATVSVAHSKTPLNVLKSLIEIADVVINAAPITVIPESFTSFENKVFLDIRHNDPPVIGRLNTSIICNRVAQRFV